MNDPEVIGSAMIKLKNARVFCWAFSDGGFQLGFKRLTSDGKIYKHPQVRLSREGSEAVVNLLISGLGGKLQRGER